jgi:hypothetical protein
VKSEMVCASCQLIPISTVVTINSRVVGITGQSLPILRVCEVCSASGSDLGRSTPGRDAMRYDSLYPIFRPRRTTPKVTGPETATRSSSKNAGL